jgi:hypothetical protein
VDPDFQELEQRRTTLRSMLEGDLEGSPRREDRDNEEITDWG